MLILKQNVLIAIIIITHHHFPSALTFSMLLREQKDTKNVSKLL